MTGATLAVVPGDYADQTKRRKLFEGEHPSAEFRPEPPWWHASLIVGVRRREINRCTELGRALDEMEKLAAIEAERAAIAAKFPAWRVWLSDGWGWYAVRRGRTLGADSADGLRAELARVTAREKAAA